MGTLNKSILDIIMFVGTILITWVKSSHISRALPLELKMVAYTTGCSTQSKINIIKIRHFLHGGSEFHRRLYYFLRGKITLVVFQN